MSRTRMDRPLAVLPWTYILPDLSSALNSSTCSEGRFIDIRHSREASSIFAALLHVETRSDKSFKAGEPRDSPDVSFPCPQIATQARQVAPQPLLIGRQMNHFEQLGSFLRRVELVLVRHSNEWTQTTTVGIFPIRAAFRFNYIKPACGDGGWLEFEAALSQPQPRATATSKS